MEQKREKAGLRDPDQWREHWLDLHPSDLFEGHLARLALAQLDDDSALGTTGVETLRYTVETLRYTEDGENFEAEVSYLVQDYPGVGRVFFVLSIKSEGDPLPPWLEA